MKYLLHILIFNILLLATTNSFSQIHPIGSNILSTGNSGTGSNFNVIYHRCTWTANPDDATKTLTGSVTTYFKTLNAAVSTISFDFNNASFNNSDLAVTYHGINCTASFPSTGNTDVLNIQLPAIITNAGSVDSVTINYKGVPPPENGDALGYQRSTDPAGNNYIYTLSESYEDKDWWPCKADMQDKIDSMDINVIVPNAFWVATNGVMTDSADDGTNRTFKFKHRYPIASYLVALGIAKYKRIDLGNLAVGTKNTPFILNLFSGKTATEESNIMVRMNNNKLVFAAFNNMFGDYPFANEKHGFYEFGFGGGMEHQTFSGIGTSVMQSNTVLAHELAHQWWGDKVSFSTWNHLWLAEGFATLSEVLAFESVPSIGINPITKMASNKNTARSNSSTPIYISNIANSNTVWTNNNTTAMYQRGCMLASMTRCLLGDVKFFAGCKSYLNDTALAYRSATTADLQRNMENQFGENMGIFFSEWLNKKGTPDYTIEWGNIGNTINIKLVAQNVTSSGTTGTASTFFPMPVVIKISNSTNTQDSTIVIYHKQPNVVAYAGNGIGTTINSNIISYNLPFTPANLTFDPLNRTMANATITYNAALPVSSIDAKVTQLQKSNLVTAAIISTENIKQVILERSINNKTFVNVGDMKSVTNKDGNLQFEYYDYDLTNTKVYYRIKAITSSKTYYSKTFVANRSNKSAFTLSPNPARDNVTISVNSSYDTESKLFNFINAEGKKVLSINSSNNTTLVNTSTLAKGVYYVQLVKNNEVVCSDKLIIE